MRGPAAAAPNQLVPLVQDESLVLERPVLHPAHDVPELLRNPDTGAHLGARAAAPEVAVGGVGGPQDRARSSG